MSGDDELGDIIAELTKLKDKIVECACIKHIIDKGDGGSEQIEQFDDSFSELEELANGGNPLSNLWPVDELGELKDNVLELLALYEELETGDDLVESLWYERFGSVVDRLRELAK